MPRQLKKKPTQSQIDEFKYKLEYKIFDIEEINNSIFYMDRNWNIIWDNNINIVGFIHNDKYIFFNDIDEIIKSL